SMFPRSKPRSSGRRAARRRRPARSRCFRLTSTFTTSSWHLDLMDDAHRTVETVARASYGRLLAYLSCETHDVAGAEDALSEALVAALTSWPKDGVPRQPEAWLLTTARHRLIDQARRRRVRHDHEATVRDLAAERAATALSGNTFPDRRAELLFVCAHPEIDPSLHTPLMLQ